MDTAPFRPMRRRVQQMDTISAEAILRTATSGVLSLIGDGGYPYGVPMSYVYHDGHIYFHSAIEGHKVDAIRSNSCASFTVIGRDEVLPQLYTSNYASVICFGHIHIVSDEAERREALRLLGQRYNPGDEAGLAREMAHGAGRTLVLRLDIQHLSGKEGVEAVRQRAHANDC